MRVAKRTVKDWMLYYSRQESLFLEYRAREDALLRGGHITARERVYGEVFVDELIGRIIETREGLTPIRRS